MTSIEFEKEAVQKGYKLIAGVDEVGRGPLAGPVFAAACILPLNFELNGINDSKKLTPRHRKDIHDLLVLREDVYIGVGVVDNFEIDKMNILKASLLAMTYAVKNLPIEPDFLLIDGKYIPPTHIASKAIIKGDSKSMSIGAASIIAKHRRDGVMRELHLKYPEYDFNNNMGYGTKNHINALEKFGPCPIHRLSFEPAKSITLKQNLTSV